MSETIEGILQGIVDQADPIVTSVLNAYKGYQTTRLSRQLASDNSPPHLIQDNSPPIACRACSV